MRARWLLLLTLCCADARPAMLESELSASARRFFPLDRAVTTSRFARIGPDRTRLEGSEPGLWLSLSLLTTGGERLQFHGDDWYEDAVRLKHPMTGPLRYVLELGPGVREVTLDGARVVVQGAEREIATAPMIAFDARGRVRALDARLAGDELQLSLDDRGLEYPVWIDPKWETKGTMSTARFWQTATALPDGKVLLAGGTINASTYVSTSEVYDPTSGAFGTVRVISPERAIATASLTSVGVLLVGGRNATISTKSALRYDLSSNDWAIAAPLPNHDRRGHCAAVMGTGADEQVFVFGGEQVLSATSLLALADGFAFSTASGAWLTIPAMSAARNAFACGIVGYVGTKEVFLAAGGSTGTGALASTEIFSPIAGSWKTLGNLSEARGFAAHGVLSDGRFIVAGGTTASGMSRAVDLYTPETGSWSAGNSMIEVRGAAAATVLPNGSFFVAGGGNSGSLSSAELYDPRTKAWTGLPAMTVARYAGTATVVPLAGGHFGVLVAGGSLGSTVTSSAELFTFDANGTACTLGATCESGFCTDGVCCSAACDGSCESCTESGKEGTCTLVDAPRAGHAACTGTGPCASACSGARACTFPDSSKTCSSACAGDDVLAAKCDGAGTCGAAANASCGQFRCVDTACATSCTTDTESARCKSTAYCASGTCVSKKPDGEPCAEARECTSSACCATNHLCGACPAEIGREVAEPWCSCRAPGAPGRGSWPLVLLVALRTARALGRKRARR